MGARMGRPRKSAAERMDAVLSVRVPRELLHRLRHLHERCSTLNPRPSVNQLLRHVVMVGVNMVDDPKMLFQKPAAAGSDPPKSRPAKPAASTKARGHVLHYGFVRGAAIIVHGAGPELRAALEAAGAKPIRQALRLDPPALPLSDPRVGHHLRTWIKRLHKATRRPDRVCRLCDTAPAGCCDLLLRAAGLTEQDLPLRPG